MRLPPPLGIFTSQEQGNCGATSRKTTKLAQLARHCTDFVRQPSWARWWDQWAHGRWSRSITSHDYLVQCQSVSVNESIVNDWMNLNDQSNTGISKQARLKLRTPLVRVRGDFQLRSHDADHVQPCARLRRAKRARIDEHWSCDVAQAPQAPCNNCSRSFAGDVFDQDNRLSLVQFKIQFNSISKIQKNGPKKPNF